jgi:uncharacterized membrane protein YfcA
MEVFGYTMALLIGVSLGLIGGGGSILAVPVLAYIFGLDEKLATAYSLFVVGSAALVGAIRQHKHGYVDLKTALVFGLPAVAGVWLVRHFVIPVLPDVLLSFSGIDFTRRMAIFGLFAILMILAAYSMIFSRQNQSHSEKVTYRRGLILIEGLVVGGPYGFCRGRRRLSHHTGSYDVCKPRNQTCHWHIAQHHRFQVAAWLFIE